MKICYNLLFIWHQVKPCWQCKWVSRLRKMQLLRIALWDSDALHSYIDVIFTLKPTRSFWADVLRVAMFVWTSRKKFVLLGTCGYCLNSKNQQVSLFLKSYVEERQISPLDKALSLETLATNISIPHTAQHIIIDKFQGHKSIAISYVSLSSIYLRYSTRSKT